LEYIDKFYVSSTESITKRSGRLFQFILQALALPAKKILHIGDDFMSDFFTPKQLGIKSLYYYNKNVLKNYKKIYQAIKKIKYKRKTINHKFINNFISQKNHIKDDYAKISHHISPVLATFSYQTLLDMYSKGIRKIFFFAREGILLQKIFNQTLDNVLLFQSKKHEFKLKVLYISRLSSSCAIYKDIKNIDLLIETTQQATGFLSIPNFIKTYGLSTSDFSNETLKIIESYHSIDKNSFSKLMSYTSFGREFNQLIKEKRNLLEGYLAKNGILAEGKIGLVDLGWGGTIQKNISHFLPDYPSVKFFGYYFGTNNLIFDKSALAWDRSTFFPGCIVSYQNDYQSRKFNGAIPFLESLCGFDKIGTTIGYKSTLDGAIVPIFDCSIKKNSYN
ncbi:MAG: hypothetical protein O7C59_02760, partial [Rickettsia endosymbiont of Ixodes persulcatus]|nr:hypothetical protein [Rickettsia endosymbiont of Ixodes persulcatus]